MAVAEISIEPLGTDSASISNIIRSCVEVLKGEKQLKFDVTPMGTVIEGDRHQILSVAERMEEACFRAGANRCIVTIKLDERHDKPMSMEQMEREVEEQVRPHTGTSDYWMGLEGSV